MSRNLTPQSSLENLKREAKRWLRALRAGEPNARARFTLAHPTAPATPGLRDVQHALAREHGFTGWTELSHEIARRIERSPTSRDAAVQTLLSAADQGDVTRVGDVLDAHPDIINEAAVLAGHTGRRTALHFAMNSSSEPVVAVLLARGADPNVRDEGDNAMPLHFAAERGNLEIVRRLIEHGADPIGTGDYHELDVIGWATCFGRSREVADYLLAHGARHNIFSAVATGAIDAIRDLVARSPAELDRAMDSTNRRRRPLQLAVVQSQPGSLDALLELGADTEATEAAGLTPLDQAALNGEREMAHRLLEHGARIGLPSAVALEMPDEISRVLRDDPYCLRPGGRWDKLIIRASERAPERVIEALARGGASVHVRDDHRTAVDGTHGYTALHAAAFHGNEAAALALLRHGASPLDREDKYWGSPAGWAAYAGHTAVRDLILEGAIDVFDAILYDRNDRMIEILTRDSQALERRLREYVTGEQAPDWLDGAWTPAAFAVAYGKLDALRILADRGADLTVHDSAGRPPIAIADARGHDAIATFLRERPASPPGRAHSPDSPDDLVASFLRMACLDWRVSGSLRATRMHDAGRILARHPGIAKSDIYTAVSCGDPEEVRRILEGQPDAALAIGGPRSWPPLLYLCSARLPQRAASDSAVPIAQELIDRGADPNVFYLGGNADIHYTALTCVLGRGEELASMHPRASELTSLLLERGADPHDGQVLYNVFADNTSRHLLDEDIVWLLELMYEHSVRRGHRAKWNDPTWPMFAMRGAPSLGHEDRHHPGAHFMLSGAVDRNLLGLAEWMMKHGAGPNTPAGKLWNIPQRTLYQDAIAGGHLEMAQLLVRYGATPTPLELTEDEAFIDACLAMDHSRVRALASRHPEYLQNPRALFTAVERDRADVVEMLLDLGVSPNVDDPESGRARALHVAAANGAERCAALLIERGADIDWRETRFESVPLGWASFFQQRRMVELLGTYSRDVWALTYAGLVERLRDVLRDEPALACVTSKDGDTPLMWLPSDAVSALEIASLLLEHGTDPTRRTAQGQTAAEIATRRGLDDVAELLSRRG